jgi:TonB family protein
METVTQPPVEETVPLRLFSDGRAPGDLARFGRAGVLSLLIHGAVVALILSLPATMMTPPVVERHLLTPLVEPLTELTQKAPNKTKLSKEFEAAQVEPRPRLAIPPAPLAPAPFVPPTPPPQAAAMPEPPRLERPRLEPPPPPPQIQAQEKPKLAFEMPVPPPPQPAAISRVPIPNPSVQEAVRSVARGGAGMGMVVGDMGASGIGEGITQSPTSGVQASNLQLLSDPQGVDFRPYLTRILAAVRRNWFAVMPESVRLGRRGRVGIQFAIARNGSVPKLVIVSQSGTEALDRAAVAGISASNPFPPLPTEFKGNEIRLQFNFAYNIPR